MIIGQKNLLETIQKVIESGRYPKFSLVTGAKNSGKQSLVTHICKQLNLPIVKFGCGIEQVRNIIDLAYEQTEPICYVCTNADGMSLGAKNALLKITEEPPNNAYFMITLESLSNTLETIKSRGILWQLEDYSLEDLLTYRQHKNYSAEFDKILEDICNTTGEVDELFTNDIPAFYSFAETVAFKIHIPTTGNIFKIPKQLKTKEAESGFDPILFFKTIRNLYIKEACKTQQSKYLWASTITSECLQDLVKPNLNKVGTIDKWIMDVRTILR